jgi:hypothetical protein
VIFLRDSSLFMEKFRPPRITDEALRLLGESHIDGTGLAPTFETIGLIDIRGVFAAQQSIGSTNAC